MRKRCQRLGILTTDNLDTYFSESLINRNQVFPGCWWLVEHVQLFGGRNKKWIWEYQILIAKVILRGLKCTHLAGTFSPENCRNVCPAVELAGGRGSQDTASETSGCYEERGSQPTNMVIEWKFTWCFNGTWRGSSEDTVLEHTWTTWTNSCIFIHTFKDFCEVIVVALVDRLGQVDCLVAFSLKTDVYCVSAKCFSLRHETLVL